MKNIIKDIITSAGREFEGDNRSYYCRTINEILSDSRVIVEVCPQGKVWTNSGTGRKSNLKVRAAGYTTTYLSKGRITAFEVLRIIGTHLLVPEVKEKILSEVSLHDKCERCGGSGRIPHFHYYCEGICFGCYGLGLSKQKDMVNLVDESKTKITKARQLVFSYRQPGYFPEALQAEKIQLLGKAHQTAEKWVLFNGEFYYVGQPVCRSSEWYKCRKDMWEGFIGAWNKINEKYPDFQIASQDIKAAAI